jgi:hypothetical protein
MTEKLEIVLEKISPISNCNNSSLIQEFCQFMVDNRKSDRYKKIIARLWFFSAKSLVLISPFTISKRKKRYLNLQIKESSKKVMTLMKLDNYLERRWMKGLG